MGSKTATASRNTQRQADTAELMSNIMTGGEISKAREAELQKAADYGRGIQFIPGSPTVQGLTQGNGQPVFRTGTTAQDFTGRIVASAPTFSELLGDASRALVGGTADKQVFTLPTSRPGTPTMDFANMVPDPRPTQGIIPALINTGGLGGLALNLIKDLYSSGTGKVKDFFSPPAQPQPDLFSSGADATGGAFVLPESLVPENIEREDIPAIDKRARLKELIERDVAPGSQELNVDEMTDQEVDLRLQSYGEPLAVGGRVGFKNGGDSSNILMNFRDAFSEIIGFPSYVLQDEQEFLNDLLEDSDDLSMKEIKAQMKSENAPTRKYLNNLSDEEKKDALNKIIDYQEKTRLGRTSGLFEALESLRGRGMAMARGGLTPPESGPQSEGIESLFKNK